MHSPSVEARIATPFLSDAAMSRAFIVRQSPIHGTGVFAARAIEPEEEIVEYQGRLVTPEQADAGFEDDGHTFLFNLNDHYVIDASFDGNEARWINHSCEPNCEAVLEETDDGNPAHDRVVIQAMRRIEAGEELTYDYGLTSDEPITDKERAMWKCRCGAPGCRGILLKLEAETGEA